MSVTRFASIMKILVGFTLWIAPSCALAEELPYTLDPPELRFEWECPYDITGVGINIPELDSLKAEIEKLEFEASDFNPLLLVIELRDDQDFKSSDFMMRELFVPFQQRTIADVIEDIEARSLSVERLLYLTSPSESTRSNVYGRLQERKRKTRSRQARRKSREHSACPEHILDSNSPFEALLCKYPGIIDTAVEAYFFIRKGLVLVVTDTYTQDIEAAAVSAADNSKVFFDEAELFAEQFDSEIYPNLLREFPDDLYVTGHAGLVLKHLIWDRDRPTRALRKAEETDIGFWKNVAINKDLQIGVVIPFDVGEAWEDILKKIE